VVYDRIVIAVGHLWSSCWRRLPWWVDGSNFLIQFIGTLRFKSYRTYDLNLLSQLRLPQPGGLVPHIYIHHGLGGPVIHRSLSYLLVSLYISLCLLPIGSHYRSLGIDHIENTASSSSFIVVFICFWGNMLTTPLLSNLCLLCSMILVLCCHGTVFLSAECKVHSESMHLHGSEMRTLCIIKHYTMKTYRVGDV
jgi:hypothetical protein